MTRSELKVEAEHKPIVFLMGPTASGKTALAIDLYQMGNFEIISVDSAMVYTQLDIGSAKPDESELSLAPHHLIDFIDPKASYSASSFRHDAIELINQIHSRGNTPLLTGGTMMYFKALREGLANLPETVPAIRKRVRQALDSNGSEFLHAELAKFDSKTAARLHVNDSQRITRAIEVYQTTGKSLSYWHDEQKEQRLVNPLFSVALAPKDRSILHKRIEQRFEQMLENGLLDEVASLYSRGDLDLNCPSMRSVGYRQLWLYMQGELTLIEAKERAIIATRQLAKRQYTWLRSWEKANWFDPTNECELVNCRRSIAEFVGQCTNS